MCAKRNQLLKLYASNAVECLKEIRNYFTFFNFKGELQYINILQPTGYVMHHQFNIQQLYVLPTLYLFLLYLSEKKQRIVPLTA